MSKPSVQARYLQASELEATGYGQPSLIIARKTPAAGKPFYQAALLLPGNADHNDRACIRQGQVAVPAKQLEWADRQWGGVTGAAREWSKQPAARQKFKALACAEPYLMLEGSYQDLIIFLKDMSRADHMQWVDNLFPKAPVLPTQGWLNQQMARKPSLPARPKPFDPFEL